jgi:hypothetical protein
MTLVLLDDHGEGPTWKPGVMMTRMVRVIEMARGRMIRGFLG